MTCSGFNRGEIPVSFHSFGTKCLVSMQVCSPYFVLNGAESELLVLKTNHFYWHTLEENRIN